MKSSGTFTYIKTIVIGYIFIIAVGSLLLSLPIASRSGTPPSYLDALFTSTSATCVTGFVRFDTYTQWSLFGQIVLLFLIQLGGIGFITITFSFVTFTKRKIGLSQRVVLQESVGAPQLGGVVKITRFIFAGTLLIELIGAVLLCFYFCPRAGFFRGIYFSVFHSVSAFCSSGFDLMGYFGPYSSFTKTGGDLYLTAILAVLLVIGSLGFFVWYDLKENKLHFSKYKLHTKIVITFTAGLLLLCSIAFFVFEQGGKNFADKTLGQQILYSIFESASARTTGFNITDMETLTQASKMLVVFMMLVGGSSGSTAGGIKTTTLAVIVLSVISKFRRRKSIEVFGRRLEDDTLRNAVCIVTIYFILTVSATLAIAKLESISITTAVFEAAAAISTTGLSMNLTPTVSVGTQIILMILMLFGRIGPFSFIYAFASDKGHTPSQLPHENIRIG